MDIEFSNSEQRDRPDFDEWQMQKQRICHGMELQQSRFNGWLVYVWESQSHGSIYWDSTETYTAIKIASFIGSHI